MNCVNLMGRLTADPTVSKTPNDISVCSFTLAVDRFVNNERKADFINCVAWRQNADNIARFFKKGNLIAINGSIQTRQYQDKDTGKNRTAFEILVDRFYFTGTASNTGNTQPTVQSQPEQSSFILQKPPKFSTADLDGFSALAADDGDLPF